MATQVPSNICGVKEFFEDRCVLVTGATGFMGKVMMEKLLRTCQRMKRLYFLVRTKPEMGPEKRMRQLLKAELFEKLLRETPELAGKLFPVAGDVTSPSLGLSEEDEKMLAENVSVVFHLAATVRFDETLKKALRINLGGTKKVLDLCRKMSNLKVLVYVSTAYSHCQRLDVDEVFYPSFDKPLRFMEVIENMNDGLVSSITPVLLSGRPNCYSLSKALTEQLLVEEAGDLPVVVIRPSIVGSCWREPFAGWTEGYYGPNGMLVAYSKGLLRCMVYDPECSADFVPVDAAINLAIAAAWYTAVHEPDKMMIYNCTVNEAYKMTFADNRYQTVELQEQQPLRPIWHPSMMMFRSLFFFRLYFYLTILFPGYFVDAMARVTGKKPIFVRMQKKILHISTVMSFYTTRRWRFSNANMFKLWGTMSPQCRQDFYFDIRKIDWPTYFRSGHGGVKSFVVKEDPKKMEEDRSYARKMRFIHHACQLTIAVLLWRFTALLWALF